MFYNTCRSGWFGLYVKGQSVPSKGNKKVVDQRRKKAAVVRKKKISAPRPEEKALSKKEIEEFRILLLSKRSEIVGSVNEMKDEALRKNRLDASGDLSSMPIHMADIGSDNYEQEFALGLMDSEITILRKIDGALERIENKTYGICEGTGKVIQRARLKARPWARYCVEYAEKMENGFKPKEG